VPGRVPGQRPLRPFAAQLHRLGQRAGRRHARRRGDLAELVLVRHGPEVRAVALAFARHARQLRLEPDDPQHQLRRLGRHRGLPDLFEPGEQDLDLGPRRLAPQQPDLAHPLDDVGPLQQGVAGLARRALGIAGPARRLGGVAAGDEMAAERLLPGREQAETRHDAGLGQGEGNGHGAILIVRFMFLIANIGNNVRMASVFLDVFLATLSAA